MQVWKNSGIVTFYAYLLKEEDNKKKTHFGCETHTENKMNKNVV